MALALDYQSFGVQKIGSDVQIPDNKLAKLMYYLDSVFTIFGDGRYSYYTNFHNYHLLNKRQEEYVLYLARTYNASLMLDNQLFIIYIKLFNYEKVFTLNTCRSHCYCSNGSAESKPTEITDRRPRKEEYL